MKDDTISRAAALDAFLTELTKRERKNFLHTWSTVEVKYFVADMLEKLSSAQPGWIPCSERMPSDYQWYYATCKSLVDNRENWVVEGCYTPWEHFNSTPMIKCGEAEVIAWMPKGFPEPWEGGQDE